MTPLSKRLIIALVVSVAVNLLLGGVFAGAAIQRHRMRAERGHMLGAPPLGPRDGARLPPGDRPRDDRRPRDDHARRGERRPERLPIEQLLGDEGKARREVVTKARGAVRDALTKEPFDDAALERSLTTLRSETATTQDLIHKKLRELAGKGDAEARVKLARAFERRGGVP